MEIIEIKDIFGKLLFSHEQEDNTLKATVEEAVSQGVKLDAADLRWANLEGANLIGADLRWAVGVVGTNIEGTCFLNALIDGALEGKQANHHENS